MAGEERYNAGRGDPLDAPGPFHETPSDMPGGVPVYESANHFPGFKGSVVLLGVLILMNLVAALMMVVIMGATGARAPSAATLATAYVFAFGVALWFGVVVSRSSFREVLRVTSFPPSILVPVVAALFGLWVLLIEIMAFVTRLIPIDEGMMEEMSKLLFKSLWVGIPLLVVAAPVLEEALFRGIILRGLLERYSPVKAVTLNAVFFATAHFNVWQLPASFGTGLFLGWVYLRTRSLALCVLLHALHNLVLAFVAQYVADLLGISMDRATMPFIPWWVVVGGAFLLVFGVYTAERRLRALPPAAVTS
jgi:membrane protease YdiL (CAAX protease family)